MTAFCLRVARSDKSRVHFTLLSLQVGFGLELLKLPWESPEDRFLGSPQILKSEAAQVPDR